MAYDLGTAHGKIELEYNGHGAVARADADMKTLDKSSKDSDTNFKRLGKTLGGFAGTLGSVAKVAGKGLALGAAGVEAANLGIQIAGIIPQLASVASLSAALPGLFTGGVASVLILKASFAGVGDAVKAAFDPTKVDQFNKSLKNLAPAAQSFAKALQSNAKGLKEYQKGIQQAFFSSANLKGAVTAGVSALHQLRPQVTGLASDFGGVTKQVTTFATSQKSVAFLKDALDTFRNALDLVTPSLTPILEGLRAVGSEGLPLITRLAGATSGVTTAFADWLDKIQKTGQIQVFFDTAISTLTTLGGLAKNVGSILGSIFSAAQTTSGGLLNNLQTITGQFATFLKSADGKSAITGLFTAIGAAAKQLAPVITTLVGALAGALGPALSQIAQDLGPSLLATAQALAPGLAPLAKAIADIVTAVAPVLPPLAQFAAILARIVSQSVSGLAAELGPLAAALGGALTAALTALNPLLDTMSQTLPLAAKAGAGLAAAFAPLAPAIVQVAQAFAKGLVDNLPQLLSASEQLIPILIQLAATMSGALAQALTAVAPYIPGIVSAFIQFDLAMFKVYGTILKFVNAVIKIGQTIAGIPAAIAGGIAAFVGVIQTGFSNAVSFVSGGISAIGNFFAGLPGKIGAALAALPGVIGSAVSNAMSRLAFLFGQGIGLAISFTLNFPGQVGRALAALPGTLSAAARNAWNALRNAFNSGVASAVSAARALPGRARSAISSLGGLITSTARSAWASLRGAFSNGISSAASLARSLPGRIRSAVGNLGSLLVSAGRDAVNGLVAGLRAGVGAAAAAARSLGSSILSGIKSTLKINSPSKAMITIGRFVTQGLEKGLLAGSSSIKSTANRLANYVLDAFNTDKNSKAKGLQRLISGKQKNSVLGILNSGTKQLQTLVSRSNAIASKLKNAQASLAAVQKQYNDTYASAVQKTKDTFNVVTAGSGGDVDTAKERLKAAVAQAKQFAKDIQTLAKRGLSKDLIQQLVDAGAADGGAMASALANSDQATLKQFNSLQGQLNSAAKSVGKTTADALYGAGVKAAAGLVKGLQNQEAAIQKQMDKIAAGMVKAIKKALKIKSPSRVMFDLGAFTSEGLLNGLNSLQAQIRAAAGKLASSTIIPTVKLGTAANVNTTQAALSQLAPISAPSGPASFGPYQLQLNQGVLTAFTIDAITGAPKVVAAAASEGSRKNAFVGSGRGN